MNDNTSTTHSTSPRPTDGATIVPAWSCPPWCAHPPRHYFEADGVSNSSTRTHELGFGEVTPAVDDSDPYGPATLSVDLCQRETIVDAGAGGIRRGQPFLFLGGLEAQLSGAEGRQLGEMLIAAANRLDQIAAEAER